VADKVTVFRRADGDWGWRRQSENGRVVSGSGEGYQDKGHALRMAVQLNQDDEDGVHFEVDGVAVDPDGE
jgi:uncharacterized protein YegP (UPF0339 family)